MSRYSDRARVIRMQIEQRERVNALIDKACDNVGIPRPLHRAFHLDFSRKRERPQPDGVTPLDNLELDLDMLEGKLEHYCREMVTLTNVVDDHLWKAWESMAVYECRKRSNYWSEQRGRVHVCRLITETPALRCSVCDVEYCPLVIERSWEDKWDVHRFYDLGRYVLLGPANHSELREWFYYPCCSDACQEIASPVVEKIEDEREEEWQRLMQAKRRLKEVRSWIRTARSLKASSSPSAASEPATTSQT